MNVCQYDFTAHSDQQKYIPEMAYSLGVHYHLTVTNHKITSQPGLCVTINLKFSPYTVGLQDTH